MHRRQLTLIDEDEDDNPQPRLSPRARLLQAQEDSGQGDQLDTLAAQYARAYRALDPDQREAVDLPFSTVAVNSANAGSGKTRVIVTRLLRYAAEGHNPASAVVTSFTSMAAREIKQRYAEATGDVGSVPVRRPRPVIGTGHGFGMRLIGRVFGLTRTPLSENEGRRLLRALPAFQATMPDFEELRAVMGSLCSRADLHLLVWPEFNSAGALVRVHDVAAAAADRNSPLRARSEFRDQYALASWFCAEAVERRLEGQPPLSSSQLRANAVDRHCSVAGIPPDQFIQLLVEYVSAKGQSGVLDFADMLYLPFLLMVQHPHLTQRVRQQFTLFMLDEAQDMSALDYALVAMAAGFPDWSNGWPAGRSLLVVGDSKQSLYGWRDGMPMVMDNLDRYLTHKGVSFGQLRRNYRSVESIVRATGAYASSFTRRNLFESIPVHADEGEHIEIGRFPNTIQEDKALIARLRKAHADGIPWRSCTVLARLNRDLDELQVPLIAAGIPFKVRSTRRLSRTEAFGVMNALLGLVVNPRNVLAASAVALALRGVGPKGVAAMEQALGSRLLEAPEMTVMRALPLMREKAAVLLREALDLLLTPLQACAKGSPVGGTLQVLSRVLQSRCSWQDREIPGALLRMTLKWEQVDRILTLMLGVLEVLEEDSEFAELPPFRQMQDVCAALSLAEASEDAPGTEDGLTLTTIHGYKGGENDAVFVVRLTRRNRVTQADLDGERCAFYVAVTRAKKLLCLFSSDKISHENRWRVGILNVHAAEFTSRHRNLKNLSAPVSKIPA